MSDPEDFFEKVAAEVTLKRVTVELTQVAVVLIVSLGVKLLVTAWAFVAVFYLTGVAQFVAFVVLMVTIAIRAAQLGVRHGQNRRHKREATPRPAPRPPSWARAIKGTAIGLPISVLAVVALTFEVPLWLAVAMPSVLLAVEVLGAYWSRVLHQRNYALEAFLSDRSEKNTPEI